MNIYDIHILYTRISIHISTPSSSAREASCFRWAAGALYKCICIYSPRESSLILSFSHIFSLLLFHLASPYASIFCDFVLVKSRVIWWASVMRWLGPNCVCLCVPTGWVSHVRMSHVTFESVTLENESCHIWVMPHVRMSHVTYDLSTWASAMRSLGPYCMCGTRLLTYDTHSLGPILDMSHMSRVTYESYRTWGMSHVGMSHT